MLNLKRIYHKDNSTPADRIRAAVLREARWNALRAAILTFLGVL